MAKIAIIGYCQTVAVLNAIGSWRESLQQDPVAEIPEILVPAGSKEPNTNGRLFDIMPAEGFSEFNDTKFCLLTSETHPAARFMRTKGNGEITLWYSDALKQFLDGVAGFDVIVSLLNGSELSSLSKMDLPEFDVFPYDDDGADRPPIDLLYISQWTNQIVSWVEASLTLMRHLLPDKKIIHVAPPPPIFKNHEFELQRPALRLKLHRENLKRLREVTSNLNILFLEERPEAVNADGFLKSEFDDGYARGNAELGRLTAKKLLELI